MWRWFVAALALLVTSVAIGQQVQQSGSITIGHVPVWEYNGAIGDPGPATNSLVTEFGVTKNGGMPLCVSDFPITSPTGYAQMCFGQSNTEADIYETSYAAATVPFYLDYNGTKYDLLAQISSIANVTNIATLRTTPAGYGQYTTLNVVSYYGGNNYNGGGLFSKGFSGCTDNGGTIIADAQGNCWYRQIPPGAPTDATTFGAHCDGVTTVNDASIIAGSNQLTSASVTFQGSDVGKGIVINPSTPGTVPFLTTITAVNGNAASLASNAPYTYPGTTSVATINYVTTINGGVDSPGTGYVPGDILSVTGGTFTVAATANVPATGLVSVTQTSGGSGYQVNDLISLTSTTANTVTVNPAIVQVTSVNSGAITGFTIVDYGTFRSNTSHINPAAFSQSGGHGTGWTFTLAASNGSFGVASVVYVSGGTYTVAPPAYASPTTDGGVGGGGTGATVDTISGVATWSYFSDDTTPLNNLETYIESAVTRGLYGSVAVPSGKNCFANYLIINQPVTWRSDGQRQGQLTMILGSAGNSLYGARPAFVTVGSEFPTPGQGPIGEAQVRFEGIQLSGMSSSTTVNINGTPISTSTDCVELARPVSNHGNLELNFENFEADTCPGNLLSTTFWSGEIIGQNLRLHGAGGDCLHMEKASNPTRIYRMVTSQCAGTAINLVKNSAVQFFGIAEQSSGIGVSVTGSFNKAAYVRFYGADIGGNTNEGMYDDAAGLTVTCDGCRFVNNNQSGTTGATDSDITIGPDVQSAGGNSTAGPFPALILNNGLFQNSTATNNIGFAQSASSAYCICVVQADGGTRNINNGPLVTNPTNAVSSGLLLGANFTVPTTSTPAPVVASGFAAPPPIVGTGYNGFQITVGSTGTASTGSITLSPTAPNGWTCTLNDVTSSDITTQTGSSTTSASFTAASNWTAGDKLNGSCAPF